MGPISKAVVGNLRPADRTWPESNSCAACLVPKGKEVIWMNNMCILARVMSAARGGKKVTHRWSKEFWLKS